LGVTSLPIDIMKLMFVCILSLLAAYPTNAAANLANVSPVSRVVELLEGLSKQIEKEGKKEEDMFESFVCWGNSVIEQKTAANVASRSEINVMESYVADLSAGKIELTTERTDLESELATIKGDMEEAKTMREKEHTDFNVARDEMNQAISALNSAVKVLGEATGKKKGSLIAVRQELKGGMQAFAEQQANLKNAVEFGDRFLNKHDSLFLRRLLLGEVPTVDWRKLNRKAGFKMGYKARSVKIQDVLAKMQKTFTINKKDAEDKDANAATQYSNMRKTKQSQLDTTGSAYDKMAKEGSAKAAAKEENNANIAALNGEIENDEKFIKQTTTALADKKKEWQERSVIRSNELSAISQAVGILHNDDARDLMKKSFGSQGFLLLQTEQKVHLAASQEATAAEALRDAATRSGDERLRSLAHVLDSQIPASVRKNFAPILKSIDSMIALLKSDEEKDLNIKQTCESDRMEDTRRAIAGARASDEDTETIERLSEEIAELAAVIKAIEQAKPRQEHHSRRRHSSARKRTQHGSRPMRTTRKRLRR